MKLLATLGLASAFAFADADLDKELEKMDAPQTGDVSKSSDDEDKSEEPFKDIEKPRVVKQKPFDPSKERIHRLARSRVRDMHPYLPFCKVVNMQNPFYPKGPHEVFCVPRDIYPCFCRKVKQ